MRPHNSLLQGLLSISLLSMHVGSSAYAQLDQLAAKVPSTANVLVVVNGETVRSSPLAKKDGWQSRQQAENAGMIALPNGASWLLMAAEMDFEFMQPLWEAAVAYMQKPPTIEQVATRSGGRLDRLAGTRAVERPNDSYVLSLGPRVIGAMSPANRQSVIRWVRESRGKKKADVSAYLSEALQVAQDSANHVVVALDLDGILAPAEVAQALASSEVVKQDAQRQVADLVSGIIGLRLEIEIRDSPHGSIKINFHEDVAPLAELAKPLLIEILEKHGAQLPDLHDWTARTEKEVVTLEGKFSASGLRRIQTILSGPVGPWSASYDSGDSGSELIAQASQYYFQAVTGYLNDLFLGDVRPQSLHQIEVWVERYARKIEDLDQSNVDADVLSFAADVVMRLREIGTVIQRAGQRSDLRESLLFDSGRSRYGRYGAYGFFEKSYVTRDRQVVQADEASRGLAEADVIVGELRQLSAETRRTMSDRYGREF